MRRTWRRIRKRGSMERRVTESFWVYRTAAWYDDLSSLSTSLIHGAGYGTSCIYVSVL